MKILLLGEPSPNTLIWMNALSFQPDTEVRLWSIKRFSGWKRIFMLPNAILEVRKVVKAFMPDVLIGYRTTSYGFIGACSGFKPLVIAAQGESDVWPPGHWTNLFTSFMAMVAIRRSVLIHAWGTNMARSLFKLGARRSKLLIGHRGILLENFPFHEPFTSDQEIRLICTRSLFREYHHEIILNVLKSLESHFNVLRFSLVIVGDGNLKLSLLEMVSRMNFQSKILWTGRIQPHEISEWLRKSDIYISLPDTEGVSSSLLEAMASGCYPIVTDLPANREWINSEMNGRLVPLNERVIVEICMDVIQNRFKLLQGIRENRRMIEQLADARKINAYFIEHYKTLLN